MHTEERLRLLGTENNGRKIKGLILSINALYVSKPRLVHELSKTHYHELITASELDGMPVTLIADEALLKCICIYKRYNLY